MTIFSSSSPILRYIILSCIKHSHTKCVPYKRHDYERHCQHHICHWREWILEKYLPNNGRQHIQIFLNLLRAVCVYNVIILHQAVKVQLCFFIHSLFCCPFDYPIGPTFSVVFQVHVSVHRCNNLNKNSNQMYFVLKSLKLQHSRTGGHNEPSTTRDQKLQVQLRSSWWWTQWCPKHVERNNVNKI